MADLKPDPVRQWIVNSLFSDSSGQPTSAEELISYVKVFEDAFGGQSPTAIDRPTSILRRGKSAEKKTRYLILSAIKRNNKVRLHKAKRNPNNTFSIGKTWQIIEIKSIEIYDEQTFLMTMSKTYFWSAEKPDDKNLFLSKFLEVYKNLKMKMPQLIKFDEHFLHFLRDDIPETPVLQPTPITPNPSSPQHKFPPETPNYKIYDDEDDVLSLINVEELLNDFNWREAGNAAALEERLLNELAALEAANIHAIVESDDRLNSVIRQLDLAIVELDYMDNWLTLYTAELNSMGEDIHHIESQNRGLQVQTSNQKALLAELERLIQSVNIPEEVFAVLRQESLDTVQGVKNIEEAASLLQATLNSAFDDATREMVAVQEKVELYTFHSNDFCNRFFDHLQAMFKVQADALINDKSRGPRRNSLTVLGHETIENCLMKYRGLSLWMKEMDPRRHTDLQGLYIKAVEPIYRKETKEYLAQMRPLLSKRELTEEATYAFSAMTSYVHHRTSLAFNFNSNDFSRAPWEFKDAGGGKLPPEEGFEQIMLTMIPLIVREQNFISDLFHIGARGPKSFQNREELLNWHPKDLDVKRGVVKDVKVQKKLLQHMQAVFAFLPDELTSFIDYGCKCDNIQSVGMLVVIDRNIYEYQKTSQEYLIKMLTRVRQRCLDIFEKFTNEQLRAIEETKVNTKKRTGIFPFVRLFSRYCQRIEHSMEGNTEELPVRNVVNQSYERIVKAIFDSLETIVKDSDPLMDEKELLNAHIMTLENMHHFYCEVRMLKILVLDPYVKHAKNAYVTHLEAYAKSVLRKPFGKLMEFFDGIDNLLKTTAAPEEVGFHLKYNKDALKKVVSQYPGREMKKGIESLYRRVDRKHFTEEEGLLQVVWRNIEEQVISNHQRFTTIINKCYPDSNITFDFTIDDLLNYFSDLARSH